MGRMLLRPGSLAVLACLLLLAGGVAHAAKPRQAVFRVTLTATLTKEWTFTSVESEDPCTLTTRGTGRWQTKLATRKAARVRATDAGRGRVRFSGVVRALAGTATQAGAATTTADGPQFCQRLSRSVRCRTDRRTFRGGFVSIASPRRGVVRPGRLRGAEAIRYRSACLAQATEVQAIRTDFPLATAPLDAADVFGRDIPRFFSRGDTEQVTTLEGDIEGRVTERVRWTLVFRRVSS
jgi:hypothetical protein